VYETYTKLTINPNATDTCIKRFEMATCVIEVFVDENGDRIKPKDECEINHDITFRTFHKTGINNSNAFLNRWAYDKKLSLEWKKLQDGNLDNIAIAIMADFNNHTSSFFFKDCRKLNNKSEFKSIIYLPN
jgi:hypothetical protein